MVLHLMAKAIDLLNNNFYATQLMVSRRQEEITYDTLSKIFFVVAMSFIAKTLACNVIENSR